jgi:hypothetical protein
MCGRNQHGQLGLGDTSVFPVNERGHLFQPFLVPVHTLKESHHVIIAVACGGEHTLFLTSESKVFATGRGERGQLGQHDNCTDHDVPIEMPLGKHTGRKIQQIACGDSFSFMLAGSYEPPSLADACLASINACRELLNELRPVATAPNSTFPPHLLSKIVFPSVDSAESNLVDGEFKSWDGSNTVAADGVSALSVQMEQG